MIKFQELARLCEQATAPNPISYGRVTSGDTQQNQEEDAEAIQKELNFSEFLEKLITVLGSKQDLPDKLRIISRMAFAAKRNTEHKSEDAENEGDSEEGELMTHMKQKGMISGSSKPSAIFTGTREKR